MSAGWPSTWTGNIARMWNDTDVPLAIFFTFRCYGTWLHGGERGSTINRQGKDLNDYDWW